ncbi:hypothetical protein [Arthrobacter castelli]|uniref:hypothetical protein n=1 Tax=Arthrobacter castelli TaxID=271431 RepID=UPI000479C7C9|nr:hypothetical protein [Arthrobacter castelli]
MRTPVKLGAYGGALAVVFAAALGTGSVIGSPIAPADEMHTSNESRGSAPPPPADGHGGTHSPKTAQAAASDSLPGGLMVSANGYTLEAESGLLPAGSGVELNFRIIGQNGEPVTAYEQSHDKKMHVIAVRSDTTGFQHVHPELSDDGTWSVPLDLAPGTWRVFADFVPATGGTAGETVTLGVDVEVAGKYVPEELPAPSGTATVGDYTVALDGELVPGKKTELTLSVSRNGEPVTDLQPYLAAYGHLVALRSGDLAYLHVHPAGTPADGETEPGPDITFYATAPSAGDYRLYLNFRHNGVVRTAEFTVTADRADTSADTGGDHEDMSDENHSH